MIGLEMQVNFARGGWRNHSKHIHVCGQPPGIKSEDFSNLSVDVAPRPATARRVKAKISQHFDKHCWFLVVGLFASWRHGLTIFFCRIVLAVVDARQILGPLLKEKQELAPLFKKLAPF